MVLRFPGPVRRLSRCEFLVHCLSAVRCLFQFHLHIEFQLIRVCCYPPPDNVRHYQFAGTVDSTKFALLKVDICSVKGSYNKWFALFKLSNPSPYVAVSQNRVLLHWSAYGVR